VAAHDRRVRPHSNIGFLSRMVLLIASQHAQLVSLIVVLVFGLVVGVLGHLAQANWLILTGIAIIGGVSAYFLIYVQSGR
jgi:hypothetical protein